MNSTSSSAPARGERPPQPDLAVYLLRGGFLICLGLVVGQPWLQQLPATDLLLAITQPTAGIWSLVGLGVQTLVQHPAVVAAAWVGATAGMLLLLGELFLALLVLPIHQLRQRWLRFSYLRISLPPAGERPAMSVPPAPDRLFRALHAALGNRWVTLLLWCDGDRSVEYGLRVPQAVAGRWMPRLRAAIRSILPDARIEPLADPLEQVLQSGRILALRDYTLALPPHYPLRPALSAADAEISGLLAALRPPVGVVHVELQVALRPISSAHWRLDRGWRGRAMALRLQLQRHADYTLPSDLAAIDARLASTPFDVVVCAVVVAEVVDAAHETLAALDAALAGSTWRTAGRVQQFIPHTTRMQPTHAGRYHSAVHTIRPPLVPRLLLPANLWRTADILSSAELAALIGIPGAALDRLVDRMSNRILPAPPHAFAAAADRIILGDAVRDDGSHAPVGPTLDDLRQILHLTAGMGAGKSRLLANLCRQFIATGFTLIDGKGDDRDGSLVATVRALLPPADERRLILFDPLDSNWPIGLNPLAAIDRSRPGSIDMALGHVLAIFARLDPETWGRAAGMQQFAQMATLLVIEAEPQPTLAHIKRVLIDETYRMQLTLHCTNHEVVEFWRTVFPRLGEGQRTSRDALLRRLDLLLTAETTRLLFAQPVSSIDLLTVIEEGMILLMPLPDMTLGDLSGAIGMLYLQAFVRAAFARAGADRARSNYPLVVDELQVLIGTGDARDIATAITRLRSLGIPSVYAHQALSQLGELTDLMLINTANRVILQTNEPDASTYARLYGANLLSAGDISRQQPHEHQYAIFRCNGMVAGPLSLRPLPWPQPYTPEIQPAADSAWQQQIPQPADPVDPYLLQLVYAETLDPAAVETLSRLEEAAWQRLLARWDAIRIFQREYLLQHPDLIPGYAERQRWLSRLLAAQPRVLAAAAYQRAVSGDPAPAES